MLNIIIGDNSIGKSLVLKQIKDKILGKEISNIDNFIFYRDIGYNKERIEILNRVLDSEEIICSNLETIVIVDYISTYSPDFLKILTLICKNRDFLLLDEPDKDLSLQEASLLVDIIENMQYSFEDVFIVTHDECMAHIYEANVVTPKRVKGKLKLFKVPEDKIDEVMGEV